ncbi:MAG: hypothetical protein EXS05_24490 [Planctomycetaceae bacterium]|nr:hypothetical protein [Planctomycetaceae bacterium]
MTDPTANQPAPLASETLTVSAENTTAAAKRFDVFVIDIGWKSSVSDILRHNLEHLKRYQLVYNLYILNEQQCRDLFRHHPSVIGTEPSILVIDRDARAINRPQGFGFKLNLGMIRDATSANAILKWAMAVVAEQKPGSDLTEPVRKVMHKEGLRGAIDILADVTRSPFGEAATH